MLRGAVHIAQHGERNHKDGRFYVILRKVRVNRKAVVFLQVLLFLKRVAFST